MAYEKNKYFLVHISISVKYKISNMSGFEQNSMKTKTDGAEVMVESTNNKIAIQSMTLG